MFVASDEYGVGSDKVEGYTGTYVPSSERSDLTKTVGVGITAAPVVVDDSSDPFGGKASLDVHRFDEGCVYDVSASEGQAK